MDFIASHFFTSGGKRELRLACRFLLAHHCAHGQQSDAFDVDGVAFCLSRVIDAHTEHLIAAADTEYGFPLSVGFTDGVRHSFLFQMAQVVDCSLASGKYGDVSP